MKKKLIVGLLGLMGFGVSISHAQTSLVNPPKAMLNSEASSSSLPENQGVVPFENSGALPKFYNGYPVIPDASSAEGFYLDELDPKDPILSGQGNNKIYKLDDLRSKSISAKVLEESKDIPEIRLTALKETAASLGAKNGLIAMTEVLGQETQKRAALLDKMYNFQRLLIEKNMLPPVIEDGGPMDVRLSDDAREEIGRVFKIKRSARLVPVVKPLKDGYSPAYGVNPDEKPVYMVPTWRDYLLFTFAEPMLPHETLLPKNDAEKAVWDLWLQKGWEEGEKQAIAMYNQGSARLQNEFKGMLIYKVAYEQGLVTKPELSEVNLGVTGGGNEMKIDNRVLRIVDHSSLVPDQTKWLSPRPY